MTANQPRRLPSLAAALVGGLALTSAFPTLSWWPLAYVGLALLFVALRRDSLSWAFLTALVFHLAAFLPLLWWAYFSVGTLPWVALSVVESAIMALAGVAWVGVRRVGRLRNRPILSALAFAVIYTGGEEVRSVWPFGGFPWGRVAFSQADALGAPLAFLAGMPLLTLGVAFVGAVVAAAGLSAAKADGAGPRWRVAAIGLALAAIVAIAPAAIRLPSQANDGTLQVGAVQGNIADSSHGAETRMRGVTTNHVNGTKQLAAEVGRGALDVVLWPENAADISPRADRQVAAEIDGAAQAVGAPILVGSIEFLPDKTRKNVSLLWEPGRGVIDSYAKQHPAPFAEYIPARSFVSIFSDKVNLVTSEMVPGTGPATITLPVPRLDRDVRLADVICFEVAYDDIVRQGVELGGELIVVQTNNASFGMTAEGAQQLAMTRLRAIEHGRAAVQISTVGISAMIAPNGRVLDEGGLFTAEQFHEPMALRTQLSPASRVAGPLGWATMLCAGLAALIAGYGAIRTKRRNP